MSRAGSSGVQLIAFEILEQCNFYCDFCVRNAHRQLSDRLSFHTFKKRLGITRRCFSGLRHVALTGGEPFLHPSLLEMVEEVVSLGLTVSITTNGSIRNQQAISRLSALSGVFIILSLDGPSDGVHDDIRGFTGAFDRLKEFAALCSEFKLDFGINITVSQRNAPFVFDTIMTAHRLGAVDVSVSLVKPEGRGSVGEVTSAVLADVARQVERSKEALYGALRVQFTEPLAHIFDVSVYQSAQGRSCGAGGSTLHVRCDGTVLLCTSCTQSIGNIDVTGVGLRAAWEEDARLAKIRGKENLGGACGSCPVFDYCGGCRCRAEKAGGFLDEDPLCPKSRSPERVAEATKAIQLAEARIDPSAARDPASLRAWLREWSSEVALDREKRDFTGQRVWGHDYRIEGNEVLQGAMGSRHSEVLWNWLAAGVLPTDLKGLKILDVGPWTGGEALLLAALGGLVDIVEEHPDYLATTTKLADELGLAVTPIGSSLYEFRDSVSKYDIVYLSGIVSHLSDPVLGLRIAFNLLKDGGVCLLETQTSYAADGRDEFWGPRRAGWVWWNLSRPTLLEMLSSVGFTNVRVTDFSANRRVQISAERQGAVELSMRMGLSRAVP